VRRIFVLVKGSTIQPSSGRTSTSITSSRKSGAKRRAKNRCLDVYDLIINKTPLSYRTNRIIGGVAPSDYIAKLENGNETTPPIDPKQLDGYLTSHLIDPSLLRTDRFEDFMMDRQKKLLALIE
jgi:hypothetical protein